MRIGEYVILGVLHQTGRSHHQEAALLRSFQAMSSRYIPAETAVQTE